MSKGLKKFLAAAFAGVLMIGNVSALSVGAEEPYDVYNYDRWGEPIPSQAGYIADRAVSGDDLGVGHFKDPSDLFKDADNNFYIVDTGNSRIVIVDSEFRRVLKILDTFRYADGTETTLKNPKGIFVSDTDGMLYIADNDNARVIRCDADGNINLEITKPESEIFNQDLTFLPQKVLADKAGNIYVVLNNVTSGAAMFDSEGAFIGYYGANRVEATSEVLANYFWNAILSDEARAKRRRSVPAGFSNFDIDSEGFIFTSTESTTQTTDIVKKLSPSGDNLFADYEIYIGDYPSMAISSSVKVDETQLVDIDISEDGTINCLDLATGRVFQYDEELWLMFIIGTKADQLGGFTRPSALETMDDNIYVLDQTKATVTIFVETEFGEIVHEAVSLYNGGYYEEALDPWNEILKRDGNYRRAYIGIASAMLNKGEYKSAMKYARMTDAAGIYNKAFEGWRSDFLKEYFAWIIGGAAVVIIGSVVLVKVRKKKKVERAKKEREE